MVFCVRKTTDEFQPSSSDALMAGESTLVRGILVIVGLCAVVSTGVTLRNQLSPKAGVVSELTQPGPTALPNWLEYTRTGHRLGREDSKPILVVFSDFECPYCRAFALEGLQSIRARYGDSVGVIFRHFPLSNHRFAKQFAAAAVCAGNVGHFEAFHDLAFAEQDSIGLKTAAQFAKEAGVRDMAGFEACLSAPATDSVVARDLAAAKALELNGTPSIIINGTLYRGVIPEEQLVGLVEDGLRVAQ
jgi:protein-disulfide isomerase